MTDSDDRIARRYRDLAREEPPAALDAAILAKASQTGDGPSLPGPEETRVRPRFQRWAGPVSIAAVLVLGIGVSLRMQLEQPGIETSTPATESSPPSEYSMTPSAEPEPAPAPAAAAAAVDAIKPVPPTGAARQNRQDAARLPRPFADAPAGEASRSEPATSQAVPAAPPASAFAPPPTPAEERVRAAPVQAPSTLRAPEAAQGAPLRAKREAASQDSLGERDAAPQGSLGAIERRKSAAPETDPGRELERIARLREAGSHAQADEALAEFRRRRPDYRIPEGMWERVKPR